MNSSPNAEKNSQDMQAIRDKQEKRKKKIIKGVLIFSAVVIVLSAVFAGLDPQALAQKWFGEDEAEKEPLTFYPIDDPWNFPDNPDYQDMDRRLFVHNPFEGTTYSVEESQLPEEDEFVSFFYDYFQAIIQGDVEAFLDMYASDYHGAEELPSDFTSQMVYDITLYPQTEGGTVVAYRVDYRIYRNNGTLRNDMESDTIRPLIFVLTEEDGELKIKSVLPYTSIRK
jgi:hypothetical protein